VCSSPLFEIKGETDTDKTVDSVQGHTERDDDAPPEDDVVQRA
jgi:hypothetical protein